MRRDRMMTGVESSGIDATWLLANLEIASVPSGADQDAGPPVETLVLGPKAFHAAENYVLSLFQLYPNVYLHKTTRAAEKLFSALMQRVILLSRQDHADKTGLPDKHPIRRFAVAPDRIEFSLSLDDQVFWGALPMMVEAEDAVVADWARRLRERRLPKCLDIRKKLEHMCPVEKGGEQARNATLKLQCDFVCQEIETAKRAPEFSESLILVDQTRRAPYRKFQDSRTPLNQILIRQESGDVFDMAERSPIVASAETFELCRVYIAEGDNEAKDMVENIIGTIPKGIEDDVA